MNSSGSKMKSKYVFILSDTLEVKLELNWGVLVLFVLVVKLPSLFSMTVMVCTLPPGAIHALESASGIPGSFDFNSRPFQFKCMESILFFCRSNASKK